MAATFDPATLTGGAVLPNGDLTLTQNSENADGAFCTCWMVPGGKYYFEFAVADASSYAAGLGRQDFAWSDVFAGFVIAGHYLAAFQSGGDPLGSVYLSSSATPVVASLGATSAARIGFAVDLVNDRVWVRIGTDDWNGSGSATPATPSTGIDISTLAGFELFAFVVIGPGNAVTGAFGGATTYTPPAGFLAGAFVCPSAPPKPIAFSAIFNVPLGKAR